METLWSCFFMAISVFLCFGCNALCLAYRVCSDQMDQFLHCTKYVFLLPDEVKVPLVLHTPLL